jgi:hypothetical protein
MTIRRFTKTIDVDASGDATVYSPYLSGSVVSVRYVKDDYANGVDFVLSAEATGEIIWDEDDVNASATRAPRAATHSTAGVAALYAGSGTAVNGRVALAHDRIKFVIAAGGVSTGGTFHVTLES